MQAGRTLLYAMDLHYEHDLVLTRQKTRQVASLLKFDKQEQVRMAAAVSEIARNALQYAGGGRIEYVLQGGEPRSFAICVSDQGPGITGLQDLLAGHPLPGGRSGLGIVAAKRLMDGFEVDSAPGTGTRVVMSKVLPKEAQFINHSKIAPALVNSQQGKDEPQAIFVELRQQNIELLDALAKLKVREHELAQLNHELEETNKGVLALYSELDEKAASLERMNRELSETNRGIVALNAELDEKAASLQRAQTIKARFLSNMTHEFRTPLGSVLSLTRLLLEQQASLGPEQVKQVRYIRQSVSELAEMVDDLLDIAKVDAGKIQIRPQPFDLKELFGALRGMFRPLLQEGSEVELNIDEPAIPIELHTDEGKLAQILRNLIANAVKFTNAGSITVTATCLAGDWLEVAVIDSGIGIAEDDQEKIFEEFVQVSSPLARASKGTGLGLPLARRLAQALGGHLRVTSKPGYGSTFTATIPCHYQPSLTSLLPPALPSAERPSLAKPAAPLTTAVSLTEPASPLETPRALETSTILIIDDNEISRYLLAGMLQAEGFPTIEAPDGAAGIALAHQKQPAAIFLDLVMPGLSGFEVLDLIKADAALSSLPVVIHSSKPLTGAEAAQLRRHAVSILTKQEGHAPHINHADLQQALIQAGIITAPPTAANARVASDVLPRPHILHIEDKEEHRYIVRLTLEKAGFMVTSAPSGREGLELASKLCPDLIVLDIHLPDMSGFEVCRRLKRGPKTRRIPILQLSAHYTKAEDKAYGLDVGADSYLIHPTEAIELTATIHALLRIRHAEEELARSLEREKEARLEIEKHYQEATWANKCKDEFLATISHELRTPLNILLGYSEILLQHDCSSEETRDGLEAINRNAKLQAELIGDLLDVSRIISGKLKLNPEAVSLGQVIHETISNLGLAAKAKSLHLSVDASECLPTFWGDPARLQQVLWNLISNAIKFTAAGGQVTVSVQQQGDHLELAVADTGEGISPDFLPHVFERLQQEDGSIVRRHGGLGLGLAITRHIVELHGGHIRAQSPGKQQGAKFVVSLPLSSQTLTDSPN